MKLKTENKNSIYEKINLKINPSRNNNKVDIILYFIIFNNKININLSKRRGL